MLRNGETDPDSIFNPVEKPLYRRWRQRGPVKSFAIGADLHREKINNCKICQGTGKALKAVSSWKKRMVDCVCQEKTKEL